MYYSRFLLCRVHGRAALLAASLLFLLFPAGAADLEAAQKLYLQGRYAECITNAQEVVTKTPWEDGWAGLLVRAQLALGKYAAAEKSVSTALARDRSNIPLRVLAIQVYNSAGNTTRAKEILEQLGGIISSRSLRDSVRDAASLVAVGQAALLLNLDPKLVLENFYDQAKRADSHCRDAWIASGQLALDKDDYELAAKTFLEALKKFPDDPEIELGLARAYAPSDAPRMGKYLDQVLAFNSNNIPAILMYAEHLITAEEYDEAGKQLTRALNVNPWEPDAWAYRAVLAHLASDTNAETSARQSALKYWTNNPHVDHLIGRQLSQKYRFTEGARYQQQALAFEPDYLPSKIQLAQDWLRLGREAAGWELADEVHRRDGYDVTAYNLFTLRETIGKYRTLTNADFIVRMTTNEAALYGDRVLALLQRAKDRLSEKYGFTPSQPTTVEIFAEQKDFGVRTFGVAHNPGFLGVCFGNVITANSPAAQAGHPENWEGVLWHEFCHVITLGLTKNKMPRWLSEGISVYESRLANPTWDRGMNPRFREMVLQGELTPVGELSSAFMTPKSALHVQFAYFESSIVVQYLVEKFGLPALQAILKDLSNGVAMNTALAARTEPLDKLEGDFAVYIKAQATNLAPGLDWTKADDDGDDNENGAPHRKPNQLVRVLRPPGNTGTNAATHNPTNYWDLIDTANQAAKAKDWKSAKAPLQKLIELYPKGVESYPVLARAHRELGETNEERAVLIKLTALEADATDAFSRLMDLDTQAADWPGVTENAERFLAVNPLVAQPYRQLATAAEAQDRLDLGIRSLQRLLLLDPSDPADVHYHLARLLRRQGDGAGARRQVLQALEEAPRFRAAQALLLEIEAGTPAKTGEGSANRL